MAGRQKDGRQKDGCGFQKVEKQWKKNDVTLVYCSVKETTKTVVLARVTDWCADLLCGKKTSREDEVGSPRAGP